MKHIHIPVENETHQDLTEIKKCHNLTWKEMLEKAGENLGEKPRQKVE